MQQRVQLNDQCWIDVGQFTPGLYDYDNIKAHIPDEDQVVKRYGRVCYLKRRTISFGSDYTYSGETKIGHAFPDAIIPYLNMANEYADLMNWPRFNQCLANWYPNGDGYIPLHSDDESELYHDNSGQTVVYGMSLTQGDGNDRKFRIRERKEKGEKGTRPILLDLKTGHGDIIVMAGLTQRYYTHEIPKQVTDKGRISLTFRTFCS